jgi:uncharacterized protein YndB with AHSA1/START domain
MERWWGPSGFSNPVCDMDVRVGGAWRIVMRAPDGTEYPCQGIYREVVPAELLVFTNSATDAAGNFLLDGLTTVTFLKQNGTTKMTVRTRAIALVAGAVRMLDGMKPGWTQSLERLHGEVERKCGACANCTKVSRCPA